MFAPNQLLEHRKPADLVREGEYRRVFALIDAMAEGVRDPLAPESVQLHIGLVGGSRPPVRV
jgi:hypothetical protein